jgi:hypothetical protein
MRNWETVEVLEGTGGRGWEELGAVINRIPLCKCLFAIFPVEDNLP